MPHLARRGEKPGHPALSGAATLQGRKGAHVDDKHKQEKCKMWALSIDVWKEAAQVTDLMQEAISGLRDADGDPLPDAAKKFFTDLLFLRTKPPGKTRKYLPKEAIREQYRIRLFFEQRARESDTNIRPRGVSPSDIIKKELADMFRTTVPIIDQIVSPRKSRQRRKPHQS
jgi:hypothetical protein